MSIMSYNGAAILAMQGKDCVAIASDNRFGVQLQTLSTDCKKIFKMHDHLYIGLTGLNTDVWTFQEKLQFRLKLFALREERNISPQAFSKLVSSMLYERRFGPYFVEPVIAGLDSEGKPFLSAMDLLGAPLLAKDFVLAGTSNEQLFGVCESFYIPDQEPEDLFETVSQCMLAAVDRDCLTGWGCTVHILTKDKVITRTLKGRMD
mmetsp:Transcript_72526/g.170564  ORF Transcript_72526/g.170564 Transcript_72526/m.170564 type:complete len:205 (-) Transcript_72526:1039-1653(-)|eukprot:CAMPEP_0175860216 /NCGR_PEP_ID=MMETSP0107_2-20121207/30694_1 /TAXON_ID=195067 ORGANISM="Goniomonas pacifica, Strain CCMP1869" /NCGR_SAMPLE_ID=MMETSP0107_2 /ASSEMBLY_ACC=CAM_ASM_000203 /LENGTH=204 /DNA_ID=CAMNT_0017176935 /DNA_START=52 /DNA_END=666 /DNA_ORIENTATION=+